MVEKVNSRIVVQLRWPTTVALPTSHVDVIRRAIRVGFIWFIFGDECMSPHHKTNKDNPFCSYQKPLGDYLVCYDAFAIGKPVLPALVSISQLFVVHP